MVATGELFGVVAEFETPEALVSAAERVYGEGYRQIEAYSPFPVHGLPESLGFHKTAMPLIILIGGIVGGVLGYLMQWWMMAVDYPVNIGGRPLHSWPAFIPVTFECTVLSASLFGVLGLLAVNGLPRPHHPLFSIPQFDRATTDRFFLLILSRDEKFHPDTARRLLESLQPLEVIDVPQTT